MFPRWHVVLPVTLLISLMCDVPLVRKHRKTSKKQTKVEFAISSMAGLSREALSAPFNSFLSEGRDKRVKGARAERRGGDAGSWWAEGERRWEKGTREGAAKGHMEAQRGRTEEEAGHAASDETSRLRFQGSAHNRPGRQKKPHEHPESSHTPGAGRVRARDYWVCPANRSSSERAMLRSSHCDTGTLTVFF